MQNSMMWELRRALSKNESKLGYLNLTTIFPKVWGCYIFGGGLYLPPCVKADSSITSPFFFV